MHTGCRRPHPGGDPGGEGDSGRGESRQDETATEPAPASDRLREHGFEVLLFVLAQRADLCAHEQADGESDEEEQEGDIAGGSHDRSRPELGDLALDVRRDIGGGQAVRDDAEDRHEGGCCGQPGDDDPRLAAQ
jgi:hypothetical protein